MADFPTITSAPVSAPDEPIDDTITSKSEGGYSQTRPRNTRQRRKITVKHIMSNDEWEGIKTFDSVVGGWSIFNWPHPTTGAILKVRFTTRPKGEPVRINGNYLFNVDYVVETV
jgi:phage-related protein